MRDNIRMRTYFRGCIWASASQWSAIAPKLCVYVPVTLNKISKIKYVLWVSPNDTSFQRKRNLQFSVPIFRFVFFLLRREKRILEFFFTFTCGQTSDFIWNHSVEFAFISSLVKIRARAANGLKLQSFEHFILTHFRNKLQGTMMIKTLLMASISEESVYTHRRTHLTRNSYYQIHTSIIIVKRKLIRKKLLASLTYGQMKSPALIVSQTFGIHSFFCTICYKYLHIPFVALFFKYEIGNASLGESEKETKRYKWMSNWNRNDIDSNEI